MKPIWLIVEPAKDFLISSFAAPIMAPANNEIAPTIITAFLAASEALKMVAERTIK